MAGRRISARARGFVLAVLEATRQKLVAKSPWSACLGGSISMGIDLIEESIACFSTNSSMAWEMS